MKKRTALVLGTCLSLASAVAFAQSVEGDVEASGIGYINVGGMVLKTGLGECLKTGMHGDDNLINKCEGIEEEVEEVAAVEAPAETEAVEEAVEEVVAAAPEAPAVPEPPAAPEQTATIDTREFSEMALFATNSSSLNQEGQTVMSNLFGALSEYKGITGINITGHTDSTGSDAYNQALSEQRAATVAAEIASRYPGARINVVGMGETSPIATNDTEEGRQQNRRVEIEITATRMTFN